MQCMMSGDWLLDRRNLVPRSLAGLLRNALKRSCSCYKRHDEDGLKLQQRRGKPQVQ